MEAAESTEKVRVQGFVPVRLAEQLKMQADLERRSISGLIRLAIEDRLQRGRD